MDGKRIFDLTLTFPGLVCVFPLLAVIAVILRIKLGTPVLFKQVRPGVNGNPFVLLKFRTMTEIRNKNGILLPDSDRLTMIGEFLRSTSLDELPEMINIIKGDMSIVGPRPLLMEYLTRYTPEQTRRNEVRPGLTGWAQVNGRNELSWEKKFELDVWYVDNQSVWLDIKIILMTIKKVLKREGISHQGDATMPEFNPMTKQINVE